MSDKAFRLEKKMEIVQKVHFSKSKKWDFSLTAPHCYFLWEDDCEAFVTFTSSSLSAPKNEHIPKAHIFAFSDVLLVCAVGRRLKFRAQAYLLLDEIQLMKKMLINGTDGFLVYSEDTEIEFIPSSTSKSDFFDKMSAFAQTQENKNESKFIYYYHFTFLIN